MTIQPKANRIEVEHAHRPGQTAPKGIPLATALLAFGTSNKPTITVNGHRLPQLQTIRIDGRTALVIPLAKVKPDPAALPTRCRAAREALGLP